MLGGAELQFLTMQRKNVKKWALLQSYGCFIAFIEKTVLFLQCVMT